MCDTYTPQGEPIPTNKRYNAAKIFSHPDVLKEEPWYALRLPLFFLVVTIMITDRAGKENLVFLFCGSMY